METATSIFLPFPYVVRVRELQTKRGVKFGYVSRVRCHYSREKRGGNLGSNSTCCGVQKIMSRVEATEMVQGEVAQQLAVLMEIEGVLADVHRFGHRQSYNVAFQDLGLDCAIWTETVYADLLKSSGGVDERMLTTFFTRIGWPAALPTSERTAFVRKIITYKKKALEKLASSGKLPLRPGLNVFVDELIGSGVPVVVLAAYYKDGEDIARLLVKKLGPERASKMNILGQAEVESSAYGQLVFGAGARASVDEQLAVGVAKAVASQKQKIAEEVASMLKLSVNVDTSFSQGSSKIVAALRAASELARVEASKCILLAGAHLGVQAARRIGMPCVVVRSSLTSRAEFPGASALAGYGEGDLTLAKILDLANQEL